MAGGQWRRMGWLDSCQETIWAKSDLPTHNKTGKYAPSVKLTKTWTLCYFTDRFIYTHTLVRLPFFKISDDIRKYKYVFPEPEWKFSIISRVLELSRTDVMKYLDQTSLICSHSSFPVRFLNWSVGLCLSRLITKRILQCNPSTSCCTA